MKFIRKINEKCFKKIVKIVENEKFFNNIMCMNIIDFFFALFNFIYTQPDIIITNIHHDDDCMVFCGSTGLMSLFGIVFPLFLLVNIPRTIVSILMIIKYRGNDQVKKDKWYLIRYKERSFTLFTQIFYLFFYLVTVGLYYQQIVDQNYSDSTNNMSATIIAFKTFVIVGDVMFELYFYLKMMPYSLKIYTLYE